MIPSLTALLLLTACHHHEGEDTASPDDTASETASDGQSTALIATVATDYAVAALSSVDLESLAVSDNLTAVSSDPALSVTGGLVIEMNRGADNGVRVYTPGQFSAPISEFSTGDGSNPHDAEICGGALFVSLYGEATVGVYDPESGTLLGQVDLSAYDDGDGLPESGSMVAIGDTLYLALEQLDENSTYWSAVGGTVVAIDCESRTITRDWSVGPVPSLSEDPSQPDTLVVRTGAYFDADGNFAWDGGLWRLDPSQDQPTSLGMDEADLEANLGAVAVSTTGKAIVLSTDSSWLYSISCVDLATGVVTAGETVQTFLADVAVDDRGRAWLLSRSSWAAPEVPGGLILYDLDTCAPMAVDADLTLGLEPYAIAFY